MKYRSLLIFFLVFLYNKKCFCFSSEPFFESLNRKYDFKNKENLLKRKKSDGQVHVSEKKPLAFDNEFIAKVKTIAPELTDSLNRQVVQYNKTFTNQDSNQISLAQQQFLDDIKQNFIKTYVQRRLLKVVVLDNLKPTLDNLKNRFNEEEEPDLIVRASSSVQIKKTGVPENKKTYEMGHRTDFLQLRHRTWFNCDYFNSDFRVNASQIQNIFYQLRVSKNLNLSKDRNFLSYVNSSLLLENELAVSNVATNIYKNLNLNVSHVFSSKESFLNLNYNINF